MDKKISLLGWSWKGAAFFLVVISGIWMVRLYVAYSQHPVLVTHPMHAFVVFLLSWLAPIGTALLLYDFFWIGPRKTHPQWMKTKN